MSAKTPDWMVERLRRSGMRSINPIVDITNYVMHELGQPMHAFDLDKLQGGIVVRMAAKGERLKLLDGSSVTLDTGNLVIADHNRAIALAGIMGGDNTAISDGTSSLYLEAAFFSPSMILGKARQFGMHTDASHRFERGVDSRLQLKAMERATRFVVEIAGGEPGPISHAVEKRELPKQRRINFDRAQIERLLGIKVPAGKSASIMKSLGMGLLGIKVPAGKSASIMRSLGMGVTNVDTGWKVTPPSWRFDIEGQHDLVEEIGRCYGLGPSR
jgi:phenylalanyl-tRNA synthetase beta chain